MRNLKRALSLTLASVMLLGMMVVGTSAAGYPDVSDEDNVEAIEVMQAVKVMIGDENGNFRPDADVKRAEMAVVMAKLLNLDYDYYVTSCPFTDVSGVYEWARGSVGACYANKILSGRSETTFDPDATVTAVEASSMLMRALGYFQYANDTADGFELATVRQGTKIGIFDQVGSSATTPMTRNQVAQMVLNALKSDVVEPDGRTVNLTTPDGTVLTGKVNYVSVTRREPYARAIKETQASSVGSQNDGWIVELGERLYNGELKLTDHTIDAFGRPSRYWEYKGNAIGTYAKKELLVNGEVLHEEVKGRDAYNLLGQTAIDDKDLLVFLDGAENNDITPAHLRRSNTDKLANTGKGVMTEFYVDNDYDEITIAIINTWLAEAQNDYSTVNEDIRLDVYYDVYNAGTSTVGVPAARTYSPLVELEDWPIIEGMKDGDLVRVTMAAPDHVGNASYTDYTIESIVEPDVVADATLSDYSAGNKVYSTTPFTRLSDVTTDGTRYSAAEKAIYDEELFFNYSADVEGQLRDATYNLYLDQYGNLLGIRQVEKADKYIFVVGYDQGSSVLAQAIDQALIINTDGTMETVKIDDSKLRVWDDATGNWVDAAGNRLVNVGNGDDSSVNAWFTYDVKADGTYVLDRMVKNQGVQTRYQTGAKTEYIDSMNGTLTTAFTTAVPAANYLGTGHDMPYTNATNGRTGIAYGNNDSVYITVKADKTVDTVNGSIVKVRGVTTGLRNASVRPESVAALPGIDYDTFFIYNDKGYVTYAVVIGNEGAAGYEYLYLNSAIKRTTNDEANDRYLYTYNVIRDGKLVDIQSEVNKAHTVDVWSAGALTTISTNATADPQKGDLVRAAINKDGIITEMVILPETKPSEMKPEYNADYGYTYKVDRTKGYTAPNVNPDDKDGKDITGLRTNGYTLWVITEATEDNYTLLNSDVTFLVKNPSSAKDDYSVYSAEGAVNATQANNVAYIASVATVNDPVTGYASSVIIDVVYKNDTVTPPPSGKVTVLPTTTVTETANGFNIHVPMVDVAAANRSTYVNNAVNNELISRGYYPMGTATVAALASGGVKSAGSLLAMGNGKTAMVIVTYTDYCTLSVNGTPREYVVYGGTPYTTDTEIEAWGANVGTGYIDSAAAGHHVYAHTGASIGTATNTARTVETGYVTIDRTTFGTSVVSGVKTDTITAAQVTPSVKDPATLAYVKVGGSVKVEVSVGPTAATTIVHNVSLTYTEGGTAKTSEVKPLAAGAIAATPGKVEITISNIQGAIDDITAVVATPPAAAAITGVNVAAGVEATPVNGVWAEATLSANAASAKVGDRVTVNVTLHGTADDATKVSFAGAGTEVAANSGRFSASAGTDGLVTASLTEVNLPTGISVEGKTFSWSFEVAATGTIDVTVEDQ